MSVWRTEWDCCGDVSETEDWVPDQCPFCRLRQMERDRARLLAALKVAADQLELLGYERQAGNAYSVISEVKKSQ